MPDNTDWAWAAGFIDGEGSFGVQITKKPTPKNPGRLYIRMRLNVRQIDREVLDKLRVILGSGSVSGPYLRKDGLGKKPIFTLNCTGYNLEEAIIKLWPYLSTVKKKQYLLARRRRMKSLTPHNLS